MPEFVDLAIEIDRKSTFATVIKYPLVRGAYDERGSIQVPNVKEIRKLAKRLFSSGRRAARQGLQGRWRDEGRARLDSRDRQLRGSREAEAPVDAEADAQADPEADAETDPEADAHGSAARSDAHGPAARSDAHGPAARSDADAREERQAASVRRPAGSALVRSGELTYDLATGIVNRDEPDLPGV